VPDLQARILGVAVFTLASIAGCAAPTADDSTEPVGESQDHLLAGRRLSQSEAATIIRDAGFPESAVGKLLCTIKYESNFYERASNRNRNGSSDYGLFQVNSTHLGEAGCPSSAAGLYNASTNAKCALKIYRSQGLNAWYGYQKHRGECDGARAPAANGATPSSPAPSGTGAPDTASEGGCYSGTLEEMVEARTCVESKFGGGWYQCKEGSWYPGGGSGSGPNGPCSSQHPL
jgi:lysozyme C